MAVAVAMIWFALGCVEMFLFFAKVVSNENLTGYNVNATAIPDRNFTHDESVDSSTFALQKATDFDFSTSHTSYTITEVTNQQPFNVEPLPVSGHLPTPTIDGN